MQTKIISFDTANWAPSPLEFSKLMSLIPEADQTRIKRFHFINDQKRALATCLLIRILIKTLLPETELATVFIDRTEHGRPYLVCEGSHSL
ncbi:hypothetical protein BDR26DRAFT_863939 [Obelidium mucronatum]|nr:hypothetical protein BDR26DRAFT_863939 [Obelidium mucronatum]